MFSPKERGARLLAAFSTALILRRPSPKAKGLGVCSRRRRFARSGASFEALASQERLRTRRWLGVTNPDRRRAGGAPVIGAGAGKHERPPVAGGRVTDMLGKAVLRKVAAEVAHERIAGRLGDDRGGRDRHRETVSANDRTRPADEAIGASRPSINAKSGRRLSAATARAIARSAAPRILKASISSTLANTIETLSALAKMISHKDSRLGVGRTLESSRPTGRSSGSRMTAATPTGPASGPRPTSSTPATHRWPSANASRSKSKWGVVARGVGGGATFVLIVQRRSNESSGFARRQAIAPAAPPPRWTDANASGNDRNLFVGRELEERDARPR